MNAAAAAKTGFSMTPVVQGALATALTTALSPSYLHTSGSNAALLPNATALILTLLDDAQLSTAAEHWQDTDAALESTIQLLRSGRDAIQPIQQRQRRHELRQPALFDWVQDVDRALALLPAGSSYPLLRRGVVAVLLAGWLAAGEGWMPSNDAAALRLLLKLYDLHRSGAGHKSAMEYYHFSKAAGTSVCAMSAAMGCTTFSTREQYTCLMPAFGDGPRWINRKAHASRCRRSLPGYDACFTKIYTKLAKWGFRYSGKGMVVACEARAAKLASSGYNFYSSEYTLRGRGGNVSAPPELCPQFLNLAVLRSPRARLPSHLRYIVRVTYDWMGNRTEQYFNNMTLYDWRRLLPAVLDNYYVRGLLGEGAFYARVGALNATRHLPAARAVASAMDVLLVLEDPEPLSLLGHNWGLGWTQSFLQAEGRSSGTVAEEVVRISEKVVPTGAAAEELAAANGLDEQLYDFAVLLSRLDAVVWAAAAAAGVEPLSGSSLGHGKRTGLSTEAGGGGRCGHVPEAPPGAAA